MERDSWIALDDGARAVGTSANVVRIPVKPRAEVSEGEALERNMARAGDLFIHLIDEIAEAVSKNNARSDSLARRAVTSLQRAEARIKDLEARLAKAETRAVESDELITRLRHTVLEKFERFASPSSAA